MLKAVENKVKNVFCPGSREKIIESIVEKAKDGDTVLVMGARDINQICPVILDKLRNKRD